MSTVPESAAAKVALPTEPRGDGPFQQVKGQFIVVYTCRRLIDLSLFAGEGAVYRGQLAEHAPAGRHRHPC